MKRIFHNIAFGWALAKGWARFRMKLIMYRYPRVAWSRFKLWAAIRKFNRLNAAALKQGYDINKEEPLPEPYQKS